MASAAHWCSTIVAPSAASRRRRVRLSTKTIKRPRRRGEVHGRKTGRRICPFWQWCDGRVVVPHCTLKTIQLQTNARVQQGCRLFFLPHSKILVRISAADCVYATTFRNTVFALNKCPNCLFISLGVSVYLKNLKNNIKQSKPTENETIVIIVHK